MKLPICDMLFSRTIRIQESRYLESGIVLDVLDQSLVARSLMHLRSPCVFTACWSFDSRDKVEKILLVGGPHHKIFAITPMVCHDQKITEK